MTTNRMLRPLGVKENSDTHAIRYFYGFRMIGKPWSDEQVRLALRCLQKRHPLLRSVAKDGHFFETDREIKFQRLTEKVNWSESPKVPESVLAKAPDGGGLHVEVYLLENGDNLFDLVLALQHRVFDGRSLMIFLTELLEVLEALTSCSTVPAKFNEQLDVTPPVEALINWKAWCPTFPSDGAEPYRPLTATSNIK